MGFSKSIKLNRASARLKVMYDVRQIPESPSENKIGFFLPSPSNNDGENNYVSNPLPGTEARMIIGIAFELNKQAISRYPTSDATANTINPELIANNLYEAAVLFRADQNFQEMLKAPMSLVMNFAGIDADISHAIVGDPGVGGAIVTHEDETVVFKSSSAFVVPDPFIVASQQHMDIAVYFADSSAFPSDAEWNAAGQGLLKMKCKLYVAELRDKN